MKHHHPRPSKIRQIIARTTALTLALGSTPYSYAALDIPDTPLQANISTDPNVMMILDDSGSMQFEIMPDDYTPESTFYVFPRADGVYGGSDYNNNVATVDDTSAYNAIARSPQVNTIYYNPAITYTPWSKADGSLFPPASLTCALHNPMRTGTGADYCRNLTTNNDRYNGTTWKSCTSTGSCGDSTSSKTFWPATYFWYNGGGVWNRSNYTKREIRSSTNSYSNEGRSARTDCTSGVCTYAQEIQNFANWYTYYRSRVLTARAGIGRAFSAQGTGLRVGFAAINESGNSIDGYTTNTVIRGVRQFSNTDRTTFFSDLYGHVIPAAGTPLRKALDDVGKYYSRTDDRGPWSSTPGSTGGTSYACRQSYAILMTDGYWTEGTSYQAGTTNARSDNDSTDGSTITGPNSQSYQFTAVSPFKDGRSNTLADVAAYYWKNDLHTGLTNAVPASTRDPAFWQHMVTFGVGLGVSGSIDPDAAFLAIGSTSSTVNWPDPVGSNPGKLDDLLHASVNSRGGFFSAKDPAEFASALTAMLNDIAERKSTAGSVSSNSTRLTTGSLVFSGSFNTSGWSGELEAYNIISSGVADNPTWKASTVMPTHDVRKIFTISGGNKKEFLWSNLSTADQTLLGSSDILNYIRGDRSKETTNGGTLRKRSTLLGDIVNSSPVFHKTGGGATLAKTVYVGANDGMLHAFDADTGVERFAYIPSSVISKLSQLSQSTYQHKYFVDGELEVIDKNDSILDKSYLVGTLGRGGKGLFALDITDSTNFGASNIAWEYFSTTDTDLGYMLGKPVFAKMNDGSKVIILGNGYNSTGGKAVLYIVNIETGAVQKIDTGIGSDNGLATPGLYDKDGDGLIDFIYAGDLKGNVWKFDVQSTSKTGWTVQTTPFFTAKDASNNPQPITGPISFGVNYLLGDSNAGKLYVFFGTGSYMRKTDPDDKKVQTWYALIDAQPTTPSTISGRSALKQRTIATSFSADGKPARSFETCTVGGNPCNSDQAGMTGLKGWYLDWNNPTADGERMVTASQLYRLAEPTLLASSIIPIADDPCQPGGTGYINAINAFTGKSLTESIFVITGSTGGSTVGSIDLGIGMPSKAALFVGDSASGQVVASGSGDSSGSQGGKPKTKGLIPGDKGGRLYWREIIRTH